MQQMSSSRNEKKGTSKPYQREKPAVSMNVSWSKFDLKILIFFYKTTIKQQDIEISLSPLSLSVCASLSLSPLPLSGIE